MEIRNVQRTGDMHYVYLPTKWCKANKITSSSKISLETDDKCNLIISPKIFEKKPKKISLSLSEDDLDLINKLIVSCYINPSDSFVIHLEKKMDFAKILDQKKLVSIESVELDGDMIKCESNISAYDAESLLKTMLSKIKNLIIVLIKNYNLELIEKYEEEIDRNKLLIHKAVIGSLTFSRSSKIKAIDSHYVALISRYLERIADHLIRIDKNEIKFLNTLLRIMDDLKNLIEDSSKFNYKAVIEFIKKVNGLGDIKVKDIESYEKRRIQRNLNDISETLLDKAITKEVE